MNSLAKGQYVSVHLKGGLGNRVFMILAATNYANKTGRKFVLIKNLIAYNPHETYEETIESIHKLFPDTAYYINNDYKIWRIVSDPNNNAYKYREPPLYKGESVIFDGYFQSEKYFLNNTVPKKPILEKKPHLYFLHIRLGDYCNLPYFNIPLKRYYSDAILEIIESDIEASFLIFSNNDSKAKDWIEENIKIPFEYRFSQAITAYDTIAEMSSCNGAICANSSLSWIGAYYQGEPRQNIYMPYPWIREPDHDDIYPSWCSKIKCQS